MLKIPGPDVERFRGAVHAMRTHPPEQVIPLRLLAGAEGLRDLRDSGTSRAARRHLRPPRVRGLGGRWATEDSAGPRPAPRNFVAAATGSVFLRSQHQSLRGPSERGPRGGRPLPVVGGGPPRMRGLYRYTLCKRNYSSSGLGRTGRSETSPSGRVALALRVGLREGGNLRGGTLVSLPGKCLSFWIAGPAREELAQTSLERRRLSPRARRVPRTLRARGGAITNTAGTKKRSLGRVSIEKRSARISCPGEFRSEVGTSFPPSDVKR